MKLNLIWIANAGAIVKIYIYWTTFNCKIVASWVEGNELHPMIPLDNAVTFNALSIIDLTVMVIYIQFIKWE